MAVICSFCKTGKDVRRNWVTMRNGNVYDLCKPCSLPIAALIDAGHYETATWPPPAAPPAGKP